MSDATDKEVLAEGRHVRLIRQGHWEYAERTGVREAVMIVAITDDGRLILTEQFRIPVGKPVIELPAGLVGDVPGQEDEAIAVAAKRELIEEAGYEAGEVVHLTAGPPSAGLANEIITLVRATGLRKVGPGGGDDTEDITVHTVPLAEVTAWLEQMAQGGALIDPKIYAGLFFTGGIDRS